MCGIFLLGAVMGVGEDFAAFKDNYQITQEMIGSISYRYKRITRQLNTDFRDNTSDTANSVYVGSYGRDTAAKGRKGGGQSRQHSPASGRSWPQQSTGEPAFPTSAEQCQ